MSFRNQRHSFLLQFALLAFLVRSFIPVGFMPGAGEHGLAPLVICTGAGPTTIFLPADKLPDPKAHVSHESVCGFSTAFLWGAVPEGAAVFWPPTAIAGYDIAATETLVHAVAKSYLSQGPPVLLQI